MVKNVSDKDSKCVWNKIKDILGVIVNIVIPLISWNPVKDFLSRVLSQTKWNDVWIFLWTPRFSFVFFVWLVIFGLLMNKLRLYLFENAKWKRNKFIKKISRKTYSYREKIQIKIVMYFNRQGQPEVESCVFNCVDKNYSQSIGPINRHCNFIGDAKCCNCPLRDIDGYKYVYDAINSELLSSWNNFK